MNPFNMRFFYGCLIVLLCTLYTSCKIDLLEDYKYDIPIIQVNDIYQEADTTFISISIAEQKTPMELIGVAKKLGDEVLITDAQTIFSGDSGDLLLPIVGLQAEKKYSFIIFAANDVALTQAAPISFVVPVRQPITPPCETAINVIEMNETHEITFSFGKEAGQAYKITANGQRLDMDLIFSKKPTTGIYLTTSETHSVGLSEARIEMTYSNRWNLVGSNHEVYVEKLDADKFKISFCDLSWRFSTFEIQVKGSFIVN